MTYASWRTRVPGHLIDILVPAPFFVLAGVLGDETSWPYLSSALLGVAVAGYNRWVRAGRTGQSWGRQVMRTRLVDETTGRPVGTLRAFARDVAHILDDTILYLGYLLPLWTAKRQTIADRVCGPW